MDIPEACGEERIVYEGKHIEVVRQRYAIGEREVEFEKVRRAPGVRLIIVKGGSVLLTREYRTETGGYDFRLPGGKVFDSLEEYRAARDGDIFQSARLAAKKECEEECGLVPESMTHYATSVAGATVTWDLYYFIIEEFVERRGGQVLEAGEDIAPKWFSFEDTKRMCIEGKIQEDRSVGILLRFLLSR